jgi:hypothetical protein
MCKWKISNNKTHNHNGTLKTSSRTIQKTRKITGGQPEQIIEEMKGEEKLRGSAEGNKETVADNEHKRVMEAVEEGLLQVHGFAPNTKQPGIFRLMGENCNGFNNKIGRNTKIDKALDIKDELDIDCLLYFNTG